jgi:hypothetical protein
MTDAETDAIIASVWAPEAPLTANLRALVRAAACYGWRCSQAAYWINKHDSQSNGQSR